MTPRWRFLETVRFGRPDRVVLDPGAGRESTRRRWQSEGLPPNVDNVAEYAYRVAGGTFPWPAGGPGFFVAERMIPTFEEKIVERLPRSQIVQDWKGNICEIGLEYSTEYLRSARDFVTRRWIRCPVESRADWERMKQRYDPDDPARLPADPAAVASTLAAREHVVQISLSGPFWQLREWVGFEGLCLLFYDDPALVEEMLAFWQSYVGRLLERVFTFFVPDMVHVSEDMAYKEHSMISPAMVRKFLLPTYRLWGVRVREAGCPIYAIDSDGCVGELVPIWLDGGFNLFEPVEIAAGNDVLSLRRRFGRGMAYRGGIDKRVIARGGRAIEAEITRLAPVIEDGGYIPSCDHAVPADVSWPDYVHYVGLLARATGWL